MQVEDLIHLKTLLKVNKWVLFQLRQALASSQNVATTRLYEQIIDKKPVEFLDEDGILEIIPVHYALLLLHLGTVDTYS